MVRRRTVFGLRRRHLALIAVAVLVVAALVRLMAAPVHLPVTDLVAERIRAAASGPVHIGAIGVRLETQGIALALDDVRVKGEAFSASIDRISVIQGLFGRRVRFDEAALRIDPSRGTGAPPPIPHPDVAIPALDEALTGALAAARRHGIETVSVRDGRIDVVSAGRPITEARVFQRVSADLDLTQAPDLSGRIAMTGAEGPVEARLERRSEGDGRVLEIMLADLTPKDIVRAGPVRQGFKIGAGFVATLSGEGALEAAALDLEVGRGTVVFGLDPPRTMDGLDLRLTRGEGGETLTLEEFHLRAGETAIKVVGTITPGREAGTPWRYDLEAPEARFAPSDVVFSPVVAKSITTTGSLDFTERILHGDTFQLVLPDARLDAVFAFDFSDAGPNLSGAAFIAPSSIPALLAAWPPVVAHGPRQAVLETVRGGFLQGGDLVFALTPLELDGDPITTDMIEEAISIDLQFAGGTFTSADLPIAIQRGSGAFRLRDKTLSVRLDEGSVDAGTGGYLGISSGAMTVRDLSARPPEASLNGTLSGPLSAVVSLAETFNVPQLKETPLGPQDVEGTIRAEVGLRTPLGKDVPDEERQWAVDARLTDAAAKVPIAGQMVSDANVEVLVNRRRLAARGRARIDGLAVDVNYSEIFDGEKSGAARFVLTEKDRARRGFDLGDRLKGPVVVTLEQDEDATRRFLADLTEASVDLPGLAKAEGDRLTVTGSVAGLPPSLKITELSMDGANGLSAEGEVAIGAGGLEELVLSSLSLSSGDEARLRLNREGSLYRANFAAERFDGRDLVKRFGPGSGGGGGDGEDAGGDRPAFEVAASVGSLRLNNENTVADLTVSANHDGARLTRLTATGRLNDVNAGSFAVALKPSENDTRRLQADVTELGRLLSAFDIYERMRGGRTTVDARLDNDGVIAGQLSASDFILANERTLEDIIARTSGSSDLSLNDQQSALGFQSAAAIDGMSFDRLVVDFTKRGDTVNITEAILRGPILGGTANGAVDLKNRTVLLNGTLIPAYGVNNLFGRLPLFGEILGGGEKGGLIGVTFRLVGSLDDPQLIVNPMSAIAPGIFRRIFEFR